MELWSAIDEALDRALNSSGYMHLAIFLSRAAYYELVRSTQYYQILNAQWPILRPGDLGRYRGIPLYLLDSANKVVIGYRE